MDQQSRERTCGWSSAGIGRLSEELDHIPDPAELAQRNSSHQCKMCRGGACRLGWVEGTRQREVPRESTAAAKQVSSRSSRQTGATSSLGPTGERQEHLDAIVSFAGARQRRRLFRGLHILTLKWATGDLPEECRFLLNTQLMFLKKEKDPTSKQFDDDECICSLTEAQEITADVSEGSVFYDQQDIDPKKTSAHPYEGLRKYVSRRLLALSEGETEALTTAIRQLGVGSQGGAEALAIFHQLLCDKWVEDSMTEPFARIKVDEKNCFGMTEWKSVGEAPSRFLPKHIAAVA